MQIDWNSLFVTWYSWLGSLNAALAAPVRSLSDGLGVPMFSAFLFGLLGTTAPCQLSTNIGAVAFLVRRPSERAATMRATIAYVGAKVVVYTLIGALVLVAGRQLLEGMGPYLDLPRKVVGPLMILLGLAVGGAIRLRLQMGQRLSSRLEHAAMSMESTDADGADVRRPRRNLPQVVDPAGASDSKLSASLGSAAPGAWSSFLLGAGFSLAFCPTLFLLFFGATLTTAARFPEGFTFPAFFALGTVVPLVLFIALALTGSRTADRLRRGVRRANGPLRWVGAVLLILLGLHDTLIYWFL